MAVSAISAKPAIPIEKTPSLLKNPKYNLKSIAYLDCDPKQYSPLGRALYDKANYQF